MLWLQGRKKGCCWLLWRKMDSAMLGVATAATMHGIGLLNAAGFLLAVGNVVYGFGESYFWIKAKGDKGAKGVLCRELQRASMAVIGCW